MAKQKVTLRQKMKIGAIRFLYWCRRHKVSTGFGVLVLAGVLYLAGSWVVLQVQIHFERERFTKADLRIKSLAKSLSDSGSPKVIQEHSCSYTDNGAVFAIKSLGCETDVKIVYLGVTKEFAESINVANKQNLANSGISLRENKRAEGKNDLAIYTFDNEGIGCADTTTYYDNNVSIYDRDSDVPTDKPSAIVVITCSGRARAEYFPVTTD